MADDNSTAPPAPVAQLRPSDLLNDLLNIKGAVHVSRRAVYRTMDQVTLTDHPEEPAETISAVEGTLALTELAIEQLYDKLEAMDQAYGDQEVAHG